MKQLALLMAIFVLGSLGSLYHPFWAIMLYYLLAVLRPQYLWKWALPVEWRWSLYAAIIVLISLIFHLPRVVTRLKPNIIATLMIAYGVCLMLSMLTAFNPVLVQSFGINIAKILIMALIASYVIHKLWQIQGLVLMLICTLGYIAWEINSLYLVQGRLDIFHHGYGGLDNNGAGLMLAMGIPLAYAYGVGAAKTWQRWASWIVGLLLLHAVLMTYSRGAMLAAGCGVAWLLLRHRSRWQSLILAAMLLLSVSLLAGQEIRDRFVTVIDYQTDQSAQSRFGSWSAAWQMVWDNPLTGKGIRNASYYSQNYGADFFNRTIHSQYLQIAADSGIPVVLLFMAILGCSLFLLGRCGRMCRDQLDQDDADGHLPADERARFGLLEPLVLACQASLLIYVVGAIFLSLEVFELPWVLIVIAGVLPDALTQHIQELESESVPSSTQEIPAAQHEPVAPLGHTGPALRNQAKGLARI